MLSLTACAARSKHDFAGLALYDAESNHLRVHALDFPVDQKFYEKGHTIPLEGTPAGLAFTSRKPVLRQRIDVNEFPADMVKHAVAKGLRSGCAVPLICHDRIVGSMSLASMREGAFTEPLCYTQIGGPAVATFITLLLVPVLYAIFVMDSKILKWEEKGKQLHLETTD